MTTQPLLGPRSNSEIQTHIRLWRESDSEAIRELYMQGMLYGPGSPGNIALKSQLYRPMSFVLYGLFIFGLILALPSVSRNPGPGLLLSAATLCLFFAWRRDIWMKFKTFFLSAVSGDLADIRKQYGSDPNAFWVAEIANGNAVGTIIGCVGLDTTTKPDPATAELRRMVVSPFHQRHGVGTLLLTTVIAHARERGLSSILLSTSGYQTAAMQLYEHFGFIEQQRVEVRVRFLFIVSRAYLHFYGLKL